MWSFDTAREFETANGVQAQGGNINAAGPVVANGMVFATSGYSDLGNGVRGNVLLAFAPAGNAKSAENDRRKGREEGRKD